MSVIIPGGIPRDARLRDSPVTAKEATLAMEAWKRRDDEHLAERDRLVHAGATLLTRETPNGPEPNIRQIALKMGISRTTVYAILGAGSGGGRPRKTEQQTATKEKS